MNGVFGLNVTVTFSAIGHPLQRSLPQALCL